MSNISVVILTKNEEEKLVKCLASVNWADEIIVIDDYSEDKTREIAKGFGAKVYKRKLNNNFAAQRNYGLEKASNEWVLFLDVDEVVSADFTAEVQSSKFKVQNYKAFKIRRIDYVWERELKYGEVGNVKLVRLGKKDAGRWRRRVHEIWEIRGEIGEIRGEIRHYPHRNVSEFLEKIRQYALIHARELKREGVRGNLLHVIVYPLGKFVVNYIFKLGFLDGTRGFIHATMMSFHSFIARAQLWHYSSRS